MNILGGQRQLYMEAIHPRSAEALSLHLTRHLPRRVVVGTVIIITDRPRVCMSVIKKRWATIIRELEREHSSSLDASKRRHLGYELNRMQSYKFSTRIATPGNVLVTTWADMLDSQLNCFTLYLTTPVSDQQFMQAMAFVATGGLIMRYQNASAPTA